MQYLPLGNTGLYVSRICFGTMTFNEPDRLFGAVVGAMGQETADRMVGAALDAGVNFFDTANVYGDGVSERMLGKALGDRRGDAVIATKVHSTQSEEINALGTSRLSIMRELEGSLRRLGTDWIDLYQVHSFDPTTPLEETLRALDDCVRQGKVRYIGLSNFAAWQIAKADGLARRMGTERFCSVQAYYSLVGRELEREILPAAMDLGLGTMIYSPLAGGFLSGKYTGGDAGEGRRKKFAFPPVDVERGDRIVEALREIGPAHDASPAQLALAWLLHKPGVTSVIVGATKMAQLQDNIAAVDLELSSEEMERLDGLSALSPEYPAWTPTVPRGVNPFAALGQL
ncbi:MAG: aldo/keto reductase [Sandaracinaceae bacterium]